MTTTDQLNLFCFMLGFITGSACVTFVCLFINQHRDRQLKEEGQKLIDKMTARKQVDFFFNETVRLFVMAAEAQSLGNYDLLNKLAAQHATATKRFEQARIIYLELEQL